MWTLEVGNLVDNGEGGVVADDDRLRGKRAVWCCRPRRPTPLGRPCGGAMVVCKGIR